MTEGSAAGAWTFQPDEAPRLSDAGTLIVAVDSEVLGLERVVVLQGAELVQKAEHHVTIVSYGVGRLLRLACESAPGLEADINELLALSTWRIRGTGRFYLVTEGTHRQTVIEAVDAPDVVNAVASVRGLVADRLNGVPELGNSGEAGLLVALLDEAPEPHITLYTDDPTGMGAIGIRSRNIFEAALQSSDRRAEGLRARQLEKTALTNSAGAEQRT